MHVTPSSRHTSGIKWVRLGLRFSAAGVSWVTTMPLRILASAITYASASSYSARGTPQAGELVLNRLCFGKNISCWNKDSGMIFRPLNQARRSNRANLILHQRGRKKPICGNQCVNACNHSGENIRWIRPPLPLHQGTGINRINWRCRWITHRMNCPPDRMSGVRGACRSVQTSNPDTVTHPPE